MKRVIDITVGLLLFATSLLPALLCYTAMDDSLLGIFVTPWWAWSVVVIGSVAAFAAIGLLRWRRGSALVAVVAQFALAALWFPTSHFSEANYTFSVVLLTVTALVYWRFVCTDATAAGHAEV
jgi:hypothetical protein